MRYLGIDYGSSKVGIALSDEGGTMGFPREVVATADILDRVRTIIMRERIGAVVIGESIDYSGKANPIAAAAHVLGDAIAAAGVPVFYESEILTSAAARRAPHKEEKTRAPKSSAPVDASAAALILTSYLSRTHG